MSAFTPGPWEWEPSFSDKVAGYVYKDVPKAFPTIIARVLRLPVENVANGRLMAAAPDLLAALQAIVAYQEDALMFEGDPLLALLADARTAIAKATNHHGVMTLEQES